MPPKGTEGVGLSKSQRRKLDIAVKLAEFSDCKQRHGAVVFKGNRLLSMGYNKSHTNNEWLEGHPFPHTTHAEVDACKKVDDLKGCTVYVARIFRNGQEAFSRPCQNCSRYLMEKGVKMVVYTA